MESERSNPPTVAVIIPCHNHGEYLAQAIESARNQTYPHVEIVVVDDGSTDNSRRVAEGYPQVTYVYQKNQGVSAARNNGMRQSTGEYIIFLDADDRLLPTAIADGLEIFSNSPDSAFVSGTLRWIDKKGRVTASQAKQPLESDMYLDLLSRCHVFAPATVMFRRSPLEAVGGFDGLITPCDDYDLYLRLARQYPARHHGRPVAEYRQHGANMSADEMRMAEYALEALRRQWKYVWKDAQRRRAYSRGVHHWITTYGKYERGSLWAASQWRLRGRGTAGLKAVATLARRAPQWYAYQTARQLARGVKRLARPLRRERAASTSHVAPPPPGHVHFGDLRRTEPLDPYFGFMRGQPVTLYYIQNYLASNARDVRGRVLEVMDASYTRKFGGDRVIQSDVVDINDHNPDATIIADIAAAGEALQSSGYDCVILTQTLQFIYDVPAALATVYRVLKPGGTALISVPGITKTDSTAPWYWTFTTESMHRLLEETCPAAEISVEGRGNVLSAAALLMGIAVEELTPAELDENDPHYPVCILARVVKPREKTFSSSESERSP